MNRRKFLAAAVASTLPVPAATEVGFRRVEDFALRWAEGDATFRRPLFFGDSAWRPSIQIYRTGLDAHKVRSVGIDVPVICLLRSESSIRFVGKPDTLVGCNPEPPVID